MSPVVTYSEEENHHKVENLLQAATVHLRTVFQCRWKLETGEVWTNTPSQRNKFISQYGQKTLQKASNIQKKILGSGNIDDWDLSTVSLALLNFGNDTSKYKTDNESVWKITTVRNELAHHPTKKLTGNEYNNKETIIKTALISLGIAESVINDVIKQSNISSSTKGMEMLGKLKLIAEEHMESGRFQEAINVLGEALTIPNLVPFHISVVYETRASCYLKLGSGSGWQDVESNCKQALTDVGSALGLNDRSWNAHYIAAQCYRKQNKLSEALESYGRALAISPTQKHVMNERDGCKVMACLESSGDIYDPGQMPTNLRQETDKFEYVFGRKITGDKYIKMFLDNKYPGSDEEFRGRMYTNGWSVPQNLKEAFNCFSRSAEIGYPAGIYNTALCYFHGRGVTQDIAKAREMHLKAANMSPETPGEMTQFRKNFGVAASQHALGVMYQCGNGVVQNFKTAVEWLEKGVENGFANSATNLGMIYMEGNTHFPKSTKRAEMYWKQGVNLKSYTSSMFLMKYYVEELEPEMALAAFKTSRILSFDGNLAQKEAEFLASIQSEIDERKTHEDEVEAFETLHNFDTKGLTFRERLNRKFKYEDPKLVEAIKACETVASHVAGLGGLCFGSTFNHRNLVRNSDTLASLFDRADNGSSTASRLVNTVLASVQLNNLLAKGQPFKEQDKKAMVNFLYECCTQDDDAKMIREDYGDRLMSIIQTLFTTACGRRGENDMKIRFCYVALNLQSSIVTNDTLGIELLKEGLKMYPDNRHYYLLLVKWYLSKQALSSAIQIVDQGLKRFPKDFELLLAQATCMRLQNKEPSSILEVYCKYMNEVPGDNRFRPDAYFDMGVLCLEDSTETQERKDMMAKKYYNLGLKAEQDLLECFLPRAKSPAESILEMWLQSGKIGSLGGVPVQKQDKANAQKIPVNILEDKPYLRNPVRLGHINEHRMKLLQMTAQCALLKTNKVGIKTALSIQPKLRQKPPTSMVNLKPIKLQEMVTIVDTIYENRLIDLTIIDDACFGLASIHVVAEDSNGDVVVVCLYNEEQDAKAIEKFGFGSRLTILNPYMRVGAATGHSVIRNDDVRCVIPLDGLENMCRFCGKPGTKLKCVKCKTAGYCGKECQEMDWKLLQHKKVCGVKFFGYE